MLGSLNWYALQVRQQTERITIELLNQKGYFAFWPTYLLKRRWSDRVKALELPLFPGYVFCRLDPLVRLPVLSTPRVISIVGAGKEPIAISEKQIDDVRRIVQSASSAEPWPYIERGDSVTISDGPLCGVEGILAAAQNSCRVVVSLALLRRSVAVEVDRRALLPRRHAAHRDSRRWRLGQASMI